MSSEATFAANPANLAVSREDTGTVTDTADQLANLEANVRDHARLLFKVAYGVLRNSHDAEDVVQETFLRAHRSGFREIRDTQSWLATIAFRLALDRKRKPEELDLAEFDPPAKNPDAEHQAIHHQQVDRLRTLIASLPDDLRFPIVLSAIEELNSRQIGDMLGIPESSVRGRIMRARQMLKDKMAAYAEPKARSPKNDKP
jgi:RNA polymerase sigma-70 factor (ECF subfamily)